MKQKSEAFSRTQRHTAQALKNNDPMTKFLYKIKNPLVRHGSFIYAHASPRPTEENHEYLFPLDQKSDAFDQSFRHEQMKRVFPHFDRLCFVGHTHIPSIIYRDGKKYASDKPKENEKFLVPDCKAIVTVGSVGQPRDGNVNASYVIFDDLEKSLLFRRVPYDVKTAQEKIRDASLPNIYADRLSQGA